MLAMEKRFLQLMQRDGAVSAVTGYPGMTFKAIRYEPLCGNIGTDQRYSDSFDLGQYCGPAMDAFADASTDTLVAIYDLTGSRFEDGIVGDGYDTCLCFALGQSGSGTLKSGICLFVNGDGQNDVWWHLSYDRILAGVHRPNLNRALPLCAGANVDELEASWSATAAGFSTTAEAPKSTETTARETTEYVTSVFTAANGTPTTQTMTLTNEVSAPTADSGKQDGGLDSSDKIALGVGLGIGIPTLVLMLIALSLQARSRERKKRATAEAEAAAAVAQNPGIHWGPPPRYGDYDRR